MTLRLLYLIMCQLFGWLALLARGQAANLEWLLILGRDHSSGCLGSTSSTTTGIVRTGRWGLNRLTHPPL